MALLYAQLAHALSLNDVCDALKNHAPKLARVRGAVFDKAYVDFAHLRDLTARGGFWVTRPKENMRSRMIKRLLKKPSGNVLRDDLVVLLASRSRSRHPEALRMVRAIVEVNGEEREMTFLTNNRDRAPASIADLYKSRWAIESFFKEIKQTLQLCDFLGHNKNAVLRQVWMALLLYVLVRFLAFANSWPHGFKRFLCLLRSSLWDCVTLSSLARLRGTAGAAPPLRAAAEQMYLPGFEPGSITS